MIKNRDLVGWAVENFQIWEPFEKSLDKFWVDGWRGKIEGLNKEDHLVARRTSLNYESDRRGGVLKDIRHFMYFYGILYGIYLLRRGGVLNFLNKALCNIRTFPRFDILVIYYPMISAGASNLRLTRNGVLEDEQWSWKI